MQIKFSSKLFTILGYAKDEAMRTGHLATGVDHLTLALLRHADNAACRILTELGADLSELKSSIDSGIFQKESVPYDLYDKIQPSKSSQQLVSMAAYEALRTKEPLVKPEHLLLALSRSQDNITRNWLEAHGYDYDRIKAQLEKKAKLQPGSQFPKKELMAMLGAQLSKLYVQSGEEKDIS
ncbi:MAG: hypothetical protein IIU68_05035 [Bacteroidales bacterium]|nr:hypothetical protein [Bacteroidales bacterium]MBQ1970255.1 hypothetical protein [Paludibacteraceae bacterium]MBQ2006949.1 hypothetical protein [Bacteroidales bacterium]MBQ5582700.1 hypothetical protein [Bacteroidales bacterium]